MKLASMNALIVDDEPLARDGLRMLLREDAKVSHVFEAKNGREAVDVIRNEQPNIVFLDVQMPEMDGFDVLKEVGADSIPAVVFVTAHDRYAIRAFEINAIDYLLKPVARERFEQALHRARSRVAARNEDNRRMVALLETLASPPKQLERIAVRSAGKTYFVDLQDVDWIQAAENYVQLHTSSSKHLVHATVQTLQEVLDPQQFLRIHRSLIVNVRQVKELETATHGEFVFVLRNGTRVQSSRTYHDAIKQWAANPF
ncbi:MAG TPA: LytTR family DNA-binding domain-containing protein [Steroidobacteraceae bacterium]|nr:LytTR family DNA-binding domain-containing protein [Steroidobacteraceae bacterium]